MFSAVLAGCPGGEGDGASGRLMLERTTPRRASLGSLPARARYCARDNLLTIVGASDSWSGAIALFTSWPPMRHFTVDTLMASPGTARVAARPVGDTASAALVAVSGTVDLDSGLVISGRFAAESGHDSSVVGFAGRFEGMRADTAGCPTP